MSNIYWDIFQEINERENRVVREAAKFKHVPLYEYKIDKFLKDLMESKNDNKGMYVSPVMTS